MPSNVVFPPLEFCRGTKPRQAANCRPLAKFFALPTVDTIALAVIGPMPGTFFNRLLTSLFLCHALIYDQVT
jgi:hypothetical protein